MKKIVAIVLAIFACVACVSIYTTMRTYRQEIDQLNNMVGEYKRQMDVSDWTEHQLTDELERVQLELRDAESENDDLRRQLNKIPKDVLDKLSTGATINKTQVTATAYTLRESECGKSIGSRGYGITSSGRRAKVWSTIAMDKSIPMGARVYIPYFKDAPNHGWFTKEDHGGAIKNNRMDIYMGDPATDNNAVGRALIFGKRVLDVYIIE